MREREVAPAAEGNLVVRVVRALIETLLRQLSQEAITEQLCRLTSLSNS